MKLNVADKQIAFAFYVFYILRSLNSPRWNLY